MKRRQVGTKNNKNFTPAKAVQVRPSLWPAAGGAGNNPETKTLNSVSGTE